MLSHCKQLDLQITRRLDDVNNQKDRIHAALKAKGLLMNDAAVI